MVGAKCRQGRSHEQGRRKHEWRGAVMSEAKVIVKYLILLIAATSVVGCDRVTKHVATATLEGKPARSYFFDTVRLGYAENTGSFLSLGANLPSAVRFAVFVVVAGLMLAFLVVYGIRRRWAGARLYGLALVAGGGASNLADRIMSGQVVDFLNVGVGPLRTGVFNVADMALSAGLVVLAASEYWQVRKRAHRASRAHS